MKFLSLSQGMMDFDYVCQRSEPSAACMLYPMVGGDSKQNFYWGHKEILVPGNKTSLSIIGIFRAIVKPSTIFLQQKIFLLTYSWILIYNKNIILVYKNMSDAMKKHPDADVMVNFASLRSAYDSTLEAMNYPQIKVKRHSHA